MGRAELEQFWIGKEGPFLYDPTALRVDGTTESPLTFVPAGGTNTTRVEDFSKNALVFHTNVTGEIAGLTEKTIPVAGDWVLLESVVGSNAKRKVQAGNLPSNILRFGSPTHTLTFLDITTSSATAGVFNLLLDGASAEVSFVLL